MRISSKANREENDRDFKTGGALAVVGWSGQSPFQVRDPKEENSVTHRLLATLKRSPNGCPANGSITKENTSVVQDVGPECVWLSGNIPAEISSMMYGKPARPGYSVYRLEDTTELDRQHASSVV